jgi:hypothetical protein
VCAGKGLEAPETSEAVLTEHTISLALQHLRPLCKDIPPIEMARFRTAFKCRVFEAGTSMVNLGDLATDMFVMQSGAAFMIQTTDGVESVVDTVGPGEVFGVDTLSRSASKKTWPWRVRCSQRVTALHLNASALYSVWDGMVHQGRSPTLTLTPLSTLSSGFLIYNRSRLTCNNTSPY